MKFAIIGVVVLVSGGVIGAIVYRSNYTYLINGAYAVDGSIFDPTEEECCAETSLVLTDANANPNDIRKSLIETHGDIPQIEMYITLNKRLINHDMLTSDEILTFFKLLAFFNPTKQNQKAYDHARKTVPE